MIIRTEKPADIPDIYKINQAAFGSELEANLVDRLRQTAIPIISLVAEQDDQLIGHILFSPVTLGDYSDLNLMGLGPMAVLPEQQGKGIGSELVRQGLEQCKKLGVGAVVVLGHPDYYPRFGFRPSSRFSIDCEYDVPEEVFMVLPIQADYLRGKTGTIKYHEAFNQS